MRLRMHMKGFTLVEVMIAITLMAVLSVMAWRGLDSVSRANSMLAQRTEDIGRLMRALEQLERDLAERATTEFPLPETEVGGMPAPARPVAGGAAPPSAPRAELLPPSVLVRRLAGTPFALEIIRAAPAEPGYLERVQWWQRGNALYRAVGAPAAGFPLPAPDPAASVAVLDDVSAFRMRAWEPGQGWRKLPGAAAARAAATGLELELGIRRNGEGAEQVFRRVFPLD